MALWRGLIGFGGIGRADGPAAREGSAETGRITASSMGKSMRNRTAPFVVGL